MTVARPQFPANCCYSARVDSFTVGSWLDFEVFDTEGLVCLFSVLTVRRKLPATVLLRALG